ncbi:MAG: hypothetical protein JXB48_01850 [Candidatus Latescibacteria bacterium]|nr:hypothetical protein [Candidatus Latescibacterota bacterium]
MPKRWTDEEEDFLVENAESMSRSDLADHFDVSIKSVSDKLRRLKDIPVKSVKKKKSAHVTEDPLDEFGAVRKAFIRDFIRIIDYRDLSKIIGIDDDKLKDAVEKTGIKLPYERAKTWEELNVGKYKSISDCARCQVQLNHSSFLVGINHCRKCLEKNIKHWISIDNPINLHLKGRD